MRVRDNEAYRSFLEIIEEDIWKGIRIKSIRDRALSPGGRIQLTLFDRAQQAGEEPAARSHPRMQVSMPPAEDPAPPETMFAPTQALTSADELRTRIEAALSAHAAVLSTSDLDPARAPHASQQYWRNSIRAQRLNRFFTQVRAAVEQWVHSGALAGDQTQAAQRVVRVLEDRAYAGHIRFDNDNTGTYHSFRHDEPFVHYLEQLIASLPDPEATAASQAFALLAQEQQAAIRRQRQQLYAHLDFLMRYKYAYHGINETDIERTLGGYLIDRETRHIVSEIAAAGSLVPGYELLRIAPDSQHAHAGKYVYRDQRGRLRLRDGERVTVSADLLRSQPRSAADLTFRRAPNDRGLRAGVRFDWDGNGWVEDQDIKWIVWAGHCDVKAVMEQLGIALEDRPQLQEYRSDTGATDTYDRDLLLEMVSSIIELGSVYQRMDTGGLIPLGKRQFGGARNDQLPDRLQFQGTERGRRFRWPLATRQDSFRVTSLAWPNDSGTLDRADLGTVFYRNIPDATTVTFAPNPRFIELVEGDYNVIDASGAYVTADILVHSFDERTGYLRETRESTTIDLRPQPAEQRYFLGTHVENVHERQIYRLYLDRVRQRIVGELYVYEQQGGRWRPRQVQDGTIELPLAQPLRCTLSREMQRDRPEVYEPLLDVALRTGQNICADTDKQLMVWNGVVTDMRVRMVAENPAELTERWQVDLVGRYGQARLDYLMRRNQAGKPVEYCPAVSDDHPQPWPDFLWQDFPDVGSKAAVDDTWVVNTAMLERDIIAVEDDAAAPGGFYVHDDHIKNVFELVFTALAEYRYSIVHNNQRYGFESQDAWQAAVDELEQRRQALSFES